MAISCKDFLTPKDFNLIIKTSEVTAYDGGPFSCVTIPGSPNLNDVLEALEGQICNIQNVQLAALKTSQTTDYDGTPTFGCFTLTANGSLNTIIDEIGTQICVNTSAIAALNCSDIDVGGVFTPTNYTPITANLCGHIEGIDNALGTFLTSIPACLGTNLFTDGDNGLFEADITGMASADYTLTQDATEFYSGTKSLKGVKGASSTTEKIEGSTTISFLAGESYTLIAYVRIPSGNSTGGNVSIHAYNGAAIFAEQTELDQFNGATAANQDKWILVQTQLQSSTNETLTVGVRIQGLSSSDDVFIDQMEVRCGSQTLVTQQQLIDRFRRFICPWTISGGNITTSPTLLTVDIDESLYEVDGAFVTVPDTTATTSITVIATSDNYLDIDQAGNYIVTAVAISSSEPALASGRMRLFKLTTDGSGVTATVNRQNPFPLDGIFLKDDSILTRHILDDNVTGAKLEDFGPGASTVQAANVTVDAKGRVSVLTTEFNITGPVSGEILQHDGSDFVNVPIVGNILPSASDDDTMRFDIGSGNWESSSFLRNTGTALGINLSTPQKAINMTSGLEFAINMAVPGGVGSVLVAGGSLAIDTFFYVVTALDDGGGETVVSSETSQTTDAGNKTIDISWTAVTGAATYRIYQGTTSGTYIQFFTVTAPIVTYSDDGTAGTGGSPPSVTTAFVVLLGSSHFLDDVGIGTTTPSSRLEVQGAGATSATNTVEFFNSDANPIFTIRDDGQMLFHTSTNTSVFSDVDSNILFELDSFSQNDTYITSDNGVGANGYLYVADDLVELFGGATTSAIIYGRNLILISDAAQDFLQGGFGAHIKIGDNSGGALGSSAFDRAAIWIGARASTFNAGITNSVIIAAVSATADKDDFLFTSNAEIQGGLFRMTNGGAPPGAVDSWDMYAADEGGLSVPHFRIEGGNVIKLFKAAAYAQTFATATRTHAAFTSATLTDSTGGTANTTAVPVTPVNGSGATTVQEGVINDNFADLIAQINALRVDLDNAKQLINSLVDDSQAAGFSS